ncbi:MAG: hypothetical protein M1834_008907 [Cirrosporium novae-zelandiae]|nr:MAG: hypothetical protein M1834_008907 [Cirrosporium novae-zelandiae]
MLFLATLFASLAAAAALNKRDTGCTVDLESTLTNPSDPGEFILYKIAIKWANSTDGSSFNSDYCNWANTTKAPFDVFFYEDEADGRSLEYLEEVLTPWVGTWLASDTTSPLTGVTGDYNITDVVCG